MAARLLLTCVPLIPYSAMLCFPTYMGVVLWAGLYLRGTSAGVESPTEEFHDDHFRYLTRTSRVARLDFRASGVLIY